MSLSSLDHCSIRTVKLDATRNFYVDILGMEDGDRPEFPFPGAWLYVDGVAVLHLVGVDPDDPSGLQQYLGGATDAESLTGSGAFDHIAFRAKDADYADRPAQGQGLSVPRTSGAVDGSVPGVCRRSQRCHR